MVDSLFIFNFKSIDMIKNLVPAKKNIWKFGFFHLIIFIFLLVFFDFILGSLLRHFYFKIKTGTQYGTTYSIENTKADILIFGSSRAVDQYVPSVFEDRLKLSYFNVGKEGESSTLYHYALLKAILKRYTPKVVILDLFFGDLGKSSAPYERLSSLAPYYKTHPEMRSVIELRGGNEKIKMLSHIYPFNSTIMNIIAGNLGFEDTKLTKGYYAVSPSYFISKPIEIVDKSKKYQIDSIKLNVLKLFIEDCKKANTKLFIVCSPVYEILIGMDFSILTIKEIATANDINFYNFSKDSSFLNSPKLFYNTVHLNDSGAKIFSNKLVDKILLSK